MPPESNRERADAHSDPVKGLSLASEKTILIYPVHFLPARHERY